VFFLFPLTVGEGRVRVPLVAALIALVCLLAFLPTWVFAEDPLNRERVGEVVEYWGDHPYLELDQDFVRGTLGRKAARAIDAALEQHREEVEQMRPGRPLELGHQVKLDRLTALARERSTPLRTFSLVPVRGVLQPGWLTAMFLHLGWWHLLGNLFFLWLSAPLLEDAWGRRLFALVYVASGVAAAIAHVFVDPASAASMVGASGAIAGLMGAFAVRFPVRKIAIGYFIFLGVRIFRGVWQWPAWTAAALWFLDQAWTFWRGETGGVAVAAHLGGFVFGAGVALAMKAGGLDRAFITTDEGAVDLTRRLVSNEVLEARRALDERNSPRARAVLERAVRASPRDSDARLMLAVLDLTEPSGREKANLGFVKALTTALSESELHAVEVWHQHGLTFGVEVVPPSVALTLAEAVARSDNPAIASGAATLFRRAADARGPAGHRAALEAARRLQQDLQDPEGARAVLVKLVTVERLPEAVKAEAEALLASLPATRVSSGLELDRRMGPAEAPAFGDASMDPSGLELDTGPAQFADEPPHDDAEAAVVTVTALTADELLVHGTAGDFAVPLSAVDAVMAGVVPMGARKALVVELFSPVTPPLRLVSTTANLQAHRQAASPKELYRAFLLELLGAGATALFDRSKLEQGTFPVFDSIEAFEDARKDARRSTRNRARA